MKKIITALIIVIACTGNVKAQKSLKSSNSDDILRIENYLGNYENIHPKVLYFEEGWNGYEYWMAYTPYPLGEVNAENPCIAVSHDGFIWKVPAGMGNPLAFAPEEGYNSDTHLVYNPKTNLLECWWRVYNIPNEYDAICRRVSSNGTEWEEMEVILPFNKSQTARLSPTVWIENDIYRMIFSDGQKLCEIHCSLSSDTPEWSSPAILPINLGKLRAWHQDLIVNEEGNLEMVVNLITPGGTNNTTDLYYIEVKGDLSEASDPVMILKKGEDETDFDHRSIYRSSIVKTSDEYRLYYSCIDQGWHRYMSLMRGPSIFEMKGLTEDDFNASVKLIEDKEKNYKYYDIQGRIVKENSIEKGMYIRNNGNRSEKILIK